eukprot:5400922-Alexandrium_andersonii.AAC.1
MPADATILYPLCPQMRCHLDNRNVSMWLGSNGRCHERPQIPVRQQRTKPGPPSQRGPHSALRALPHRSGHLRKTPDTG